MLLRSDGDFFENLLTGVFAYVMANHYSVSLVNVSIHNARKRVDLPRGE